MSDSFPLTGHLSAAEALRMKSYKSSLSQDLTLLQVCVCGWGEWVLGGWECVCGGAESAAAALMAAITWKSPAATHSHWLWTRWVLCSCWIQHSRRLTSPATPPAIPPATPPATLLLPLQMKYWWEDQAPLFSFIFFLFFFSKLSLCLSLGVTLLLLIYVHSRCPSVTAVAPPTSLASTEAGGRSAYGHNLHFSFTLIFILSLKQHCPMRVQTMMSSAHTWDRAPDVCRDDFTPVIPHRRPRKLIRTGWSGWLD